MASIIQKLAAWAYRTIRMNDILQQDINTITSLEEEYDRYVTRTRENYRIPVRTSRGRRWKKTLAPYSFERWPLSRGWQNGGVQMLYDMDDVKRLLAKLDAARILDKTHFGGEFQIPHTNISLNFLDDPVEVHISRQSTEKRKTRTHNNVNPMRWPQERYKRAQEKAMTYLVDWEWTVKQHEIGAQFASTRCKQPQRDDFKLDNAACNVLGGLRECNRDSIDLNIDGFEDILNNLQEDLDNGINVDKHNDGVYIDGLY